MHRKNQSYPFHKMHVLRKIVQCNKYRKANNSALKFRNLMCYTAKTEKIDDYVACSLYHVCCEINYKIMLNRNMNL